MQISISDSLLSKLLAKIKEDKIDKIVVGAVILNEKQEVLLLKRAEHDFMGGLVELPSGVVGVGESLIQALVREVKEETGTNLVKISHYVDSFDYFSSSGKSTRQLSFVAITTGGRIKLNKNEHSSYYWVEIGEQLYNSLNISKETKKIIELARNSIQE